MYVLNKFALFSTNEALTGAGHGGKAGFALTRDVTAALVCECALSKPLAAQRDAKLVLTACNILRRQSGLCLARNSRTRACSVATAPSPNHSPSKPVKEISQWQH